MKACWLFYFAVFIGEIFEGYGQIRTNFIIKSLNICDPNVDYPIKVFANFYQKGNQQYTNGNATLRVAFGDEFKHSIILEKLIGNKYFYVFHVDDRNACTKMHKYMGEFVYEIERSAQVIPNLCPLRTGRYHIHDCPLGYFEKMTVQTYPFGNLRFTSTVYDKDNKTITCLRAVVDNA